MQRHPLSGGVLFSHYSDTARQEWPWRNFSPAELACKHCGQLYWHLPSFNAIQALRDSIGRPLRINSAHRCWLHNAAVGGAPKSAHKYIAFDVSLRGHDPKQLLDAMRAGGFGSIGLYVNFIHGDLRPGRFWFGSTAAKAAWDKRL